MRAYRCNHFQQSKWLLPSSPVSDRLFLTSADLLDLMLYDRRRSFVFNLLKMLPEKHERILEGWLGDQNVWKPIRPAMYPQGVLYSGLFTFLLGFDHYLLSFDDHYWCSAICDLRHPLRSALHLCHDQKIFCLV